MLSGTVAYSGLFNGGLREELKRAAVRPGEKALSLPEVIGSADSLVARVRLLHLMRAKPKLQNKFSGANSRGAWKIQPRPGVCSLHVSRDAGGVGHDS